MYPSTPNKKERERELRQSKPWYILLPGSHTVSFRDLLSFLALILTFIVSTSQLVFVWRARRSGFSSFFL